MRLCSIQDVKASITSELANSGSDPNIIGLGRTKRGGENILAVRFYSRISYWRNKLPWFKKMTKGEMDVQFVGNILASPPETTWHRGRVRPLKIGSSISHGKVTAGTLGCFVSDTYGKYGILSNNHVIANQNDAETGDSICQPGTHDGGRLQTDAVAQLTSFIEIGERHNLVDAAYARLSDGEEFDRYNIDGLGKLSGMLDGEVEPGDMVAKFGRTTGTTLGRVTAVEVDNVSVGYSGGVKFFDRQIEVEGAEDGPFSQGGDSGSMVVSATDGRSGKHFALGLLFAGGPRGGSNGKGLTYCNYLPTALKLLNLKLLH